MLISTVRQCTANPKDVEREWSLEFVERRAEIVIAIEKIGERRRMRKVVLAL